MSETNFSAARCLQIAFLASVALGCAGCKSCGHGGPEILEPSELSGDAAAETAVVAPGPPVAEPSATLDARPTPVAPTIEELNDQAYASGLLAEVYFGFDRADLSAEARSALEHNARYLRREDDLRVLIEGHCDERGTHEYNLALGQLRASAAREFLTRLGIAPERLGTISYGEHEAVCLASNEECWRRNRRAYFRITGRVADRVTDLPPSGSRRRAGS